VTPYATHVRLFWASPLTVSQGNKKDKLTLKLSKKYFAKKDEFGLYKKWVEPDDKLTDGPQSDGSQSEDGRRLRRSSINGRVLQKITKIEGKTIDDEEFIVIDNIELPQQIGSV